MGFLSVLNPARQGAGLHIVFEHVLETAVWEDRGPGDTVAWGVGRVLQVADNMLLDDAALAFEVSEVAALVLAPFSGPQRYKLNA